MEKNVKAWHKGNNQRPASIRRGVASYEIATKEEKINRDMNRF